MVLPQSSKKVWWLCDFGHEWQSTIANRSNGNGCPYCSNKKLLVGFNDFATRHPELAAEWNPIKNSGLAPTMFVDGSKKRYGGFAQRVDTSGRHQLLIDQWGVDALNVEKESAGFRFLRACYKKTGL